MQVQDNHQIWYEKYRPQRIDDLVLPESLKTQLKDFLENPYHILLHSQTPGTGKTSTVNAIIKEGGFEALFINASLENGIDTLRSKVIQFATTQSVNDKDRIVVLDEIDNQSQSAANALRGVIEEVSKNCKFIATCNYPSKIPQPIVNRFSIFDYDKIYSDTSTMIPLIYKRLEFILNYEKVEFTPEDIKNTIKATYPSFRDAIGSLQKSVVNNKIELQVDVFAEFSDILDAIRAKDYTKLIQSTYKIANVDGFYSWGFSKVNNLSGINPEIYVILAKYQYQGAFARDQKLNLVACCTEIISKNLAI